MYMVDDSVVAPKIKLYELDQDNISNGTPSKLNIIWDNAEALSDGLVYVVDSEHKTEINAVYMGEQDFERYTNGKIIFTHPGVAVNSLSKSYMHNRLEHIMLNAASHKANRLHIIRIDSKVYLVVCQSFSAIDHLKWYIITCENMMFDEGKYLMLLNKITMEIDWSGYIMDGPIFAYAGQSYQWLSMDRSISSISKYEENLAEPRITVKPIKANIQDILKSEGIQLESSGHDSL